MSKHTSTYVWLNKHNKQNSSKRWNEDTSIKFLDVNSWGKKNFAFETIERKKKVLQLRQ